MRNENFALHIRRRRFISKIICEGLVGGGCKGIAVLFSLNGFHSKTKQKKKT